MVFEVLLGTSVQIQGVRGLDVLLASSPLTRHIKNYLIACQVEGKTPATLYSYGNVLRFFADFISKAGLPDTVETMTASTIRLFLLTLQNRKLSPETSNMYYRALHTFFTWLENQEFIKNNPFEKLKTPRVPKKIIKPFSPGDIDKMLMLCSGTSFTSLRNKAMILIFWDTGIRANELANMRLKDIEIHTGIIRVMGKGNKERLVRMGKKAQRALLAYLYHRNDELPCVWLTQGKTPLKYDSIQVIVRRICIDAGITDAKKGPHTFRHTFGTMALRNGADLLEVQILMGHSTSDTTQRYLRTIGPEDAIKNHASFSPVDRYKSH